MKKYSVIICGAGIVGMALALDFARRGEKGVVLLGPVPRQMPMTQDEYHPRVYAISAASMDYLKQLGVWRLMQPERITRVEAMEVRGDSFGALYLRGWQAARQELTWIVESGQMEQALIQALRVYGVEWIEDTLEEFADGWGKTTGSLELHGELWVAADGTNSLLRSQAGIDVDVRKYDAMGVVGHLTSDRPHQGVALQWFKDKSVLALLPLPDTSRGHQVSMVWSLPIERARSLLALDRAEQVEHLQESLAALTGGRLGRLQLHSGLHGFELILASSGMIGKRIALVGDAAHRVHPLAGQGLNLGLGDARSLARIISEREPFFQVSDEVLLRRYRRDRATDLLQMQVLTDGLKRLFDLDLPGAAWVRNAGMSLVDKMAPVKRMLIEAATRTG